MNRLLLAKKMERRMVRRVYSIDLVQVERNSDTQKKEYTELAQSKSFANNWKNYLMNKLKV
jgi:hypothetical protein